MPNPPENTKTDSYAVNKTQIDFLTFSTITFDEKFSSVSPIMLRLCDYLGQQQGKPAPNYENIAQNEYVSVGRQHY